MSVEEDLIHCLLEVGGEDAIMLPSCLNESHGNLNEKDLTSPLCRG